MQFLEFLCEGEAARTFTDESYRWRKETMSVLHRRLVRRTNPTSADSIFQATASQYAVSAEEYVGFRSGAAGRDMAAYLYRRCTSETLRELFDRFGLSHPDSASDLIRRGAKRIEQSTEAVRQQTAVEKKLGLKPESRA